MNITEIPAIPRQDNAGMPNKEDISSILEVCSICRSLLDPKAVDRKFMEETNTWQTVCKECSKLFENCKGDN